MVDHPMSAATNDVPTRAVVAHVLMVGAYLFAIGVALLLVASPFIQWMVLGRIGVKVFAAVAVGAVLFRLLVPDPVRFDPSGPEVDRAEQPELFDIVDQVASATRQTLPDAVHLIDEMNVYLAQVGGFLGIGGRRVMGIGMPLMTVLDTEEFGAVIAHEFGHLHRDSGRIGALVYMTRQAVVRQVIDAPPSLLRRPLMAYARLYLKVTTPIARSQEFAADALSATAISRRAIAGALSRLPWSTVAYDSYHRTEYLPLLRAGRRPPLLEGFETFLTSAVAREHLPQSGDAALGSSTGSALDSHPPVEQRLAALGATDADVADEPLPEVRSTALVRDLDRLEAALAARHVDVGPLDPIEWTDVGREVLVPRWRAEREELIGVLPDEFHLAALPIDRNGLAELGADVALHTGRDLGPDDRVTQGHRAARAIIGECAAAAGLDVEMVPGEPVWFGRAPEQFGFFAAYDAVVEGIDGPELWWDLLVEAGMIAAPDDQQVAVARHRPEDARPLPPSQQPPSVVVPPPVVPATPAAPVSPVVPARPQGPAPAQVAAPAPVAASRRVDPGDAIDAHLRKVFQLPAAMGRHHDLEIDGATLTYRGDVIAADDVTHVAYWAGDDAEVRLWVDDRVVRIRFGGGPKAKGKDITDQAWEASVAWIDSRVAPRLVLRALARIAERGRVQIGDQIVTNSGVAVRGRVVPWGVLAGASLVGREIEIRQRAEGHAGGDVVATLDASEPNMVLVPPLMVAASATEADTTSPTSPPSH